MTARNIVVESRRRIVVGLIALMAVFAMFVVMTQEVDAYTVPSGECGKNGNNLTWKLEQGVLTISGTGEMADYGWEEGTNFTHTPWNDYNAEIEKVKVGEGVTRIGNYAFSAQSAYLVNLSEAELPSTLVTVGWYAFGGAGTGVGELKVVLPANLKSIEYGAFTDSAIKTISIPKGVKKLDRAFDGAWLEQIDLGEVEELVDFTFTHCENLTSINLPKTLKVIGACVFSHVPLKEVVIPEGVTTLGDPSEHGGMPAFYNCPNLERVVIPSTVTYISETEFGACDGMKEVDFRGTEEQWRQLTRGINPNSSLGAVINDPAIKKEYNYGNNKINNTPTTPKKILANPMTVKGKTVTVKHKKLTKKTQSVKRSKAITVSKAQGKVTYKKVSVTYTKAKSVKMSKKALKKYKKQAAKKITINAKTGKVTVKKGLKKGTYKVKIQVKAAGNANYYAATKTVTVKIRVK